MAEYALRLFEPVKLGSAMVADLTRRVGGWKRTIRLQGGYWRGSFEMTGNLNDMLEAFQNWLGYHVSEDVGGVVSWEGLIWSLELRHGGLVRRRSYDDIANAISAVYLDENDLKQTAAAVTDTDSIARYGRKELRVELDTYATAAITARQNVELGQRAWPWARPDGFGGGESRLMVEVAGYVSCAQFRYVTATDDATGNISAWVSNVLTTDCAEFLTANVISTNTLQQKRTLRMGRRAWDLLEELTGLGDSSYNPWRIWVESGRRVNYRQLDLTPIYTRRGGVIYDAAGGFSVSPYLLRPAVVRDLDYPIRKSELGSPYADARDFLVAELSVDHAGRVTMRGDTPTIADVMDAQMEMIA